MRTIVIFLAAGALAGCTAAQLQSFDTATRAITQPTAAPVYPTPPSPPPASTYNCSSQPGPGQQTVTCTPVW